MTNILTMKKRADIGQRIEIARNSKGLNITELANKSGLSDTSINAWENNKRNIRIENVILLSNALGVPIDYFMEIDLTDSEKLKALREKYNLTQKQFGKLIGVHANTIYRWENGIKNISRPKRYDIIAKLELPPNYFNGISLPSKYFKAKDFKTKNIEGQLKFKETKENTEKKQAQDEKKADKKSTKEIKVKYTNKNAKRLKTIDKGDWIDLYSYKIKILDIDGKEKGEIEGIGEVDYKQGETVIVDFGVAMELPKGHTGYILPRSSTFLKYGLILTNGMGIIDESYKGNKDTWKAVFFALRSGKVKASERLAQFNILEKNKDIVKFKEVDNLNGASRGGYGSTGN